MSDHTITFGRSGVWLALPVMAVAGALLFTSQLWAGSARALAAKDGVWLAPHRAVYDMALDSSKAAEGVASVRGRMVFEFAGSTCDGYTLNIRLVTQITNQTGDSTVTDLRSSTWEHGAGKQFRFNSTQYRDDKLTETASGNAAKEESRKGVVVDLTKPKAQKLHYQGAILFPTQHSREVLAAAKKGRRLVQAKIFDGSEKGERLYTTTTFIGRQHLPGLRKKKLAHIENDEALSTLVSWPVTISYFDGESDGEATPAYEMSFELFANGVSRDIVIDYGDFAIRGELRSLEFFKPSDCK